MFELEFCAELVSREDVLSVELLVVESVRLLLESDVRLWLVATFSESVLVLFEFDCTLRVSSKCTLASRRYLSSSLVLTVADWSSLLSWSTRPSIRLELLLSLPPLLPWPLPFWELEPFHTLTALATPLSAAETMLIELALERELPERSTEALLLEFTVEPLAAMEPAALSLPPPAVMDCNCASASGLGWF